MHSHDDAGTERMDFTADGARRAMREILPHLGYDTNETEIIADQLLDAALCGYEYSGLPKILDLASHPKAALPRTAPRIQHETPVSALIDGGNTVGMLALHTAIEEAKKRAAQHGFAVVGVYNSWMTGRSAYFVEQLADAGLIGMLAVSSFSIVAPPGAAAPAIGTNPIAFGFPTAADPLLIDLGTSAYMVSELSLVQRRGGSLPPGVAIDRIGNPTCDPQSAREGSILNFAGYRGFAIGLAMQALGVMAGSALSPNKDYGYLLVAMRPDLLVPLEDYRRQLSETLARIKATPKQEGVSDIRLPSERALAERRRRGAEGISIDKHIWQQLQALCHNIEETQ
ncbi:Ldh family oxidoreductase [Candidimonas nitroreducens]|uniref:Lactate dehydrogenase n=1 Tax=Candidimonas nitroreducens TaxID=683354 RepID=A0A225MGK5_9BURK|nr:Ldh family oxidoreductase [Candidimonas nitroreducens]OWT60288.1 lactate dehydrogenase [Candidimonas nitroreducens]